MTDKYSKEQLHEAYSIEFYAHKNTQDVLKQECRAHALTRRKLLEKEVLVIKQIDIEEILFADNAEDLFRLYADEGKSSLVNVDVKPDNDLYIHLQEQGLLHCVGVFNEDTLVGFIIMITNTMPHYTEKATTIESQFVLKEYRAYGTGIKLMKEAERLAKSLGAVNMFMTAGIESNLGKVASSFGFAETHKVYTKSLI